MHWWIYTAIIFSVALYLVRFNRVSEEKKKRRLILSRLTDRGL
jgi:hypothetical protein